MEQAKIRVLIADDHTILREGIRSLLSEHPPIELVGEAEDGREAVDKALELQPDVILMDVSMPRMNGIEATRLIREKLPSTKVLALSMHDNEEYILPLLRAGASGYVLKQTASTDLVSAIEAVAKGHTILHEGIAEVVIGEGRGSGNQGGNDASPGQQDRPASGDDVDGLTPREIEVLTLIAEGLTNQDIADQLYISVKTVQAHRANIIDKLDLHDRVALTKYALRKNLISLDD